MLIKKFKNGNFNVNGYKSKREQFDNANRTQLKAIAAELETITRRLDYILHGRY